MGSLVDVSEDFRQASSDYFVAADLIRFDAQTGQGNLQWQRYARRANLSFNKIDMAFTQAQSNEFPASEYDRNPEVPFQISFVGPRTVRLRFSTRARSLEEHHSPMIAGTLPNDQSWQVEEDEQSIVYQGEGGSVEIRKNPWQIAFRDSEGNLLTRTRSLNDPATFSAPTPFCFVRRVRDLGRSTAASFELAHDEKIFGCGESFTRLDKRGQKLVLYLRDAMGAQSQRMYKPIPFFLSSRGYGMFVHTSTPVTCDFGQDFDSANVIYTGDDQLDLFVFLGQPKEVLTAYTAVTGRSPVPPLWSFGLWMSRITYKSETEVREVAAKLREHRIPSDVIHLDTGWFETDWQCNYEFSASRFQDAKTMIADLKQDGFRVSLWQLPYFTTKNSLYEQIVEKQLAVKDEGGRLPYLDAILDFTNPETIAWYQEKIKGLLQLGVGAIKVDFGEDAPLRGVYASGRTGWYEHNLYPLIYNRTVAEITKETNDEQIIWARSAWAGSQRYPVHWSGDAENSNSAMAATLRAGLSLGLCGFTYWSHDVGGFVEKPDADLYLRWLAFGALTSHTRCHGAPPREPWEYGEQVEQQFRKIIELKYRLMPYIYAQSQLASAAGHPLLRALFFEFPEDAGSWQIEDEYMLGTDLLVAPCFEHSETRNVYLPPGEWIDYQTGVTYDGGQWQKIKTSELPVALFARSGAVVPHAELAQSTQDINWNALDLRVFGPINETSIAAVALPDSPVKHIRLSLHNGSTEIAQNPFEGRVTWRVVEAQPE